MKLGKSRRKQLLVCTWNNYSFRDQTTIGRWVNLYWSSHEAI